MSIYRVKEHVIQASYIREYSRSLVDEINNNDLKLAVKQYTPLDNLTARPGDVTIIAAHANGFPKELYEPLWDDLYHILKAQGRNISNIFIADVVNQGQSGIINESLLGNDPAWFDTPRDYFLMINHFRNEIRHPIVGVGHSMGGVNLVNLATLHPRLFTTMILIDPPLRRGVPPPQSLIPAQMSTKRRDRWPNRAAAEASFRKSRFYQGWDPRVLELWLQYGLRELPTHIYPAKYDAYTPVDQREVTLSTTKHQEVLSFVRAGPTTDDWETPYPQPGVPQHVTHPDTDPAAMGAYYRPEMGIAFKNLATLRPSVLWIFADQSDLSDEHLCADKMANTGTGVGGSGGVKAGRVKSVRIMKVGHLVPMEKVDVVANEIAAWVVPELARYDEETEAVRLDWAKVPAEKKSVLSDTYIAGMTGKSDTGKKTSKI